MMVQLPPELERVVREAVERDASDLHLVPGEPPVLRVRGRLERLDMEVVSIEATRDMAAAVIGEEALARIGPEIGEFQRSCGRPGEFNLSVAVARSYAGITLAFRVMQPIIPSVEEIALPKSVVRAGEGTSGLIVFTGLPGSGKTTALYSLVDHINAMSARHICTVESPAHLFITPKRALVQQREIGADVPTCLAGIQAAMAQDLDVLLVGDLTAAEELQACMVVADTGHLVLTQIHAGSPEDAIARLLDLFPDDVRPTACGMLARVLQVVCAQQLLPRADGRGRVAAYGVLFPDLETRTAIASGSNSLARKSPWPEGCQTTAQHIERLLEDGIISKETAQEATAI
jgi:twitching motility protein PilT